MLRRRELTFRSSSGLTSLRPSRQARPSVRAQGRQAKSDSEGPVPGNALFASKHGFSGAQFEKEGLFPEQLAR